MSHNWGKNFNLDAPEFVPNFGGGPAQQPMQGQPGMPQFQNPQQQAQYFQQQQQFMQQQQYRNPQYQQQYQQQLYYQQQQQQQPHFNNNQQYRHQQPNNNFNNGQQNFNNSQQQGNNGNSSNNQQNVVSEKQLNQLSNNLNRLTTSPVVDTSDEPKKSAASVTPVKKPADKPVSAGSVVIETKKAQKPSAEKQKEAEKPKPAEKQKDTTPEPSVEKEKSIPPTVAPIKETEEWEGEDEEAEEGEEGAATEGNAEAVQKKKKKIVVREYKEKKETINVIFCGHVDAGKSTIGGQIMFLTGMVDKRTLEKYEREAKEKNRESWYLSWALDTNAEEREKGKTVEVGRAFFETEKKHFVILDAPGHRGFVPNMIGGASQADIAVLVISARKGEFETGFERGGQTREHAMLVKTAGVKYLIVLINKMDDATVNWDVDRYNEIKDKLSPYLKKCGFSPGKDTYFMPCSGFTGAFIKEPVDESICDWYRSPCFIDYLETLPIPNRSQTGPFRMPIFDKYKDMGTVVMGKIECGMIRLNEKFTLMPNKAKVEVTNIYCEDEETDSAICGENVKLKLKGIEEEDISSGFVLCDLKDICHVGKIFDAQVIILECPSIICPGFNSVMHIHAATVEVQLKVVIGMVDKKTGEKDFKSRPRFVKQDQIAICRFEIMGSSVACMEPFKLFAQLGRFTLRCESKTVAVGKILKVVE